MSSTTEDSDWNMSYDSRPIHSLSNNPQPTPRAINSQPPSPGPSSAPSQIPNAKLPNQILTPAPLSNASTIGQPVANPTASTPATIPGPSYAPLMQDTPQWEAAKETVLSQMVTSQDIDATPVAPARRARRGVQTGGRRGRGRGSRGGRGGRTPKTKIKAEPDDASPGEIQAPATAPAALTAAEIAEIKTETPTRGRNRGGRPRGSRTGTQSARGAKTRGGTPGNRGGRPRGSRAGVTPSSLLRQATKRKRKNKDDDESDGNNDTDVSEEFNLLAHTSSGRRITQAKTFTPIVLDPPTSSSRKANPNNNRTVTTVIDLETPTATTRRPRASKKRKVGETAVCINCGRGHSPNSNQIVFCDGCNTPWHQYCHTRPITPSVILIEEKEWLCSDCSTLRDEKSHISGKVSAEAPMTAAEKRTYFQTLEKPELVSLLLHASSLHADLPIFPAPPPAQPIPTIVEPRPLPAPIQSGMDEDEYMEIYVEAEPLPYPKAGNGIVLPPEDDDMAFLIDEDVISYSHSWRGVHGGWEGPGGMSWGGVGGRGMGFGMNSPVPIGVGA